MTNALLAEWQYEAAQTRKMLERVPDDKLDWRPHGKSMTLGHLAMHLGFSTEVFGPGILTQDVFQWNAGPQPEPATREDILALWDKADAHMRHLLAETSPEAMGVTWIFGTVEKPFMTMPRGAAVRALCFSHLIHHRGQLSVYLRLLDVAIPGMYGPSGDEKMPR